jgi:hypothetical protein
MPSPSSSPPSPKPTKPKRMLTVVGEITGPPILKSNSNSSLKIIPVRKSGNRQHRKDGTGNLSGSIRNKKKTLGKPRKSRKTKRKRRSN